MLAGEVLLSGRKARELLNGKFFQDRFPHRSEIIAVLGIAVFVCFSWSIFGFFNKLSSFILYFTPAEIGAIFAYMMSFALLESLAVTALLVLLTAVLPRSWLRDGFGYKGFIILVIATADAVLLQKSLDNAFPSLLKLAVFVLAPILLSAALIVFLQSKPRLQNLLTNIQDRFLVILFVYVPVGLISLMVVMFRNIL